MNSSKWSLVSIIVCAYLIVSVDSQPAKVGFTNTFFDDFLGTPGSLPSSADWQFDLGTTSYPGGPQWGTNEVETMTNSTSNIVITSNQTLLITPQVNSGAWTSSRIETVSSNFVCASGGKLFIEARIKLGNAPVAQQQGIWPAFWALGSAFRGNFTNWPKVSEWDILESVNGGPTMYTTIHCGIAPGGPCNEYNGIGSNTRFTKGVFHIVGFQVNRNASGTFRDETLTWFLDGNVVFTVNGANVNDQAAWEQLAHQPKFLILDVAVGGSFPNALSPSGFTPTSATIGGPSVSMEVDYVGVWNSVPKPIDPLSSVVEVGHVGTQNSYLLSSFLKWLI
jgi:beta-glucanase (GH16 family)